MSHKQQLRSRIVVRGVVQGVGFRPFVFRLARELELAGSVRNTSHGVLIEVEGATEAVNDFLLRLRSQKPPRSVIQSLEHSQLDLAGYEGFQILPSRDGQKTALILPDIATCADCLRELMDPVDRRFRYPFINCTNCGPRFSIILALPYDRAKTTMQGFSMCRDCLAEFENPLDRRFHAQPNACPVCGPHIEFLAPDGSILAFRDQALLAAADEIRKGRILAVKGLGGFHLIVDAGDQKAVERLRRRKHREEKPLALMFPDLNTVRKYCAVSDNEERLLQSPECPIVLLGRRTGRPVPLLAESVAPGNPYLGVMLPYTPLHHLLMSELGSPVVATSGNLSDEPICTTRAESLQRLRGIADRFLMHNRPVARHVDDSVVRFMLGREMVLRRARGYAPLPLFMKNSLPPLLAVGGHLKNSIAASVGHNVFVSQHIGDLETAEARAAFEEVIDSFRRLYEFTPDAIVCDMHPDYVSTRYAKASGEVFVTVQHHFAHILACMAENDLEQPVLGVAWDGTGFGPDHTVWGGEFLSIRENSFSRFAHLRPFPLPGGDKAIQQPRRTALGILYELLGNEAWSRNDLESVRSFTKEEARVIAQMLEKNLNCPLCCSVGRVFDAVASILGLRQEVRFEGQAAMELEFATRVGLTEETYPFRIEERPNGPPLLINWQETVEAIVADKSSGTSLDLMATRFHNTLSEIILAVTRLARMERVVLSGGCFQNRYLTEQTIAKLENEGFRPYWHQRIPPNDGGLAVGQIIGAASYLRKESTCA